MILRNVVLAGRRISIILVDTIFVGLVDGCSPPSSEMDPGVLPQIQLPWIGDDDQRPSRQGGRFPRYSTADLLANFVGWINWRVPCPARVFVFGSLERYLAYAASTGRLAADLAVGCDLPPSGLASALCCAPHFRCLHRPAAATLQAATFALTEGLPRADRQRQVSRARQD
jgi:hypothetical protein